MRDEGPVLESLTHRLAQCPPEFLLPPIIDGGAGSAKGAGGGIDVVAIVCDHLRDLGFEVRAAELTRLTTTPPKHPDRRNRLRLAALATWLLHDDWFLQRPALAAAQWDLLTMGLDDLAAVVMADTVVNDPDRREEFARACLKELGLRPQGESREQASDRLNTLDSAERIRVLRQTREAEARARKIREQMAKQAAEAAAARYSPE